MTLNIDKLQALVEKNLLADRNHFPELISNVVNMPVGKDGSRELNIRIDSGKMNLRGKGPLALLYKFSKKIGCSCEHSHDTLSIKMTNQQHLIFKQAEKLVGIAKDFIPDEN